MLSHWKFGAALTATCATLALLSSNPAQAADAITLKVGGVVADSHYMTINGLKPWMDQVTELTDGQVQFEYYPAQQLGKAATMMSLAQTGVVDIAEQPVAYVSEALPLSGVVELPGLVPSSCAGTAAYRQLVQPDGILYQEDFKPAGTRVLMSVVYAPYSLLTVSREIHAIDDFAGLKLRTTGGAQELMTETLGAVSVRMASPDIYQSLSRGTLDGVFFALLGAEPYDLQTIAKVANTGYSFGTIAVTWQMNEERWAELPANVQQAMETAALSAEQQFCTYADENEIAASGRLAAAGVVINEIPPALAEELDDRVASVAENWVTVVESQGKSAEEALATFKTLLQAH